MRAADVNTTARRAGKNYLRDRIDARGYFHRLLLDRLEWMLGYRPKFGLVCGGTAYKRA